MDLLSVSVDVPRRASCRPLVFPECFEAARGQLRIADGVGDIPVTQVLLDRPRIVSLVGQLEPAGVAEHVGMNREGEAGGLADARHELPNGRGGERPSAFCGEHIGAGGTLLALEPSQGSDLGPSKGMGGGQATLEPGDVQQPAGEVHLLPAERHQLAHAEAVAEGEHEQGRVSVSVPATLAGHRDELFDLVGRQVLTASEGRVRYPSRWNCPVYGYWGRWSDSP
jgi:hypothetical protein